MVRMPRADPSRSNQDATRHLFRHIFDEQELLRNPYVCSAVAAGRLTISDLQARLADAARSIEAEDRASGKHWRGTRQAAVLLECTLKRRDPAEVAGELGISVRQLFRERRAAWTRALRYLITPASADIREGLVVDVRCNHIAQLFAIGRRDAGDTLLRDIIAKAMGLERFMLAAFGAELHRRANNAHSAADMLATARSSYAAAALQRNGLCRLTMTLLDEQFETRSKGVRKKLSYVEIISSIDSEPVVRSWMIRLTTRLLISRYLRAGAAYDRRGALQTAKLAIALSERASNLPETELFDMRLLTAREDWMVRGVTPRAEAALIANYLTASANGWLPEVAHTGSLLASMMIIAGKSGSDDYARTTLAVARTLPEGKTAQLAYLNLAVAKLDASQPEDAVKLVAAAAPRTKSTTLDGPKEESQAEYALLAREVRLVVPQANISPGMSEDRTELGASDAGDPLRSAYGSRLAAMEFERRDEHRAAVRRISEAWEMALHCGDWMSHRTIGRTYRQIIGRSPARDEHSSL
jgi:hypothetical protein